MCGVSFRSATLVKKKHALLGKLRPIFSEITNHFPAVLSAAITLCFIAIFLSYLRGCSKN